MYPSEAINDSLGVSRGSEADRFWSHVDRETGPVHPTLGRCWPWTGCRTKAGYGRFGLRRKTFGAHRTAYEIANGRLTSRALVRHRCDNPPCCNPDHLLAGTAADNSADMMSRGRGAFGARNPSAVLDDDRAIAIRDRRARGEYPSDLAAAFGVTMGTITQVCNGKLWRHLPVPSVLLDGTELPKAGRKLNRSAAAEMRNERANGVPTRELSAKYGVSEVTVYRVCCGLQWGSAGGPITRHLSVTPATGATP